MRIPTTVAIAAMALPLAAQQATFSTYGVGCNDATQSFYELFNGGAFDLSGTSTAPNGWTMVSTGTGYVVLPLIGSWHQQAGVNLGLTDDSVSALLPLGFTFPFPGGTATGIVVSSNGFIYLGATGSNGCCSGSNVGLLTGPPRIAPLWMDLNPSAGGTITFDASPATQMAWVTYTNVPEFGNAVASTFQIALWSSGQVDVLFQACMNATHLALTGWSRGTNARDPGSIDLSASIPFVTSTDTLPLRLGSAQRPITGTTMTLATTDIPAGSPLGSLLAGLTQVFPGQSLAALGMPGCQQFVAQPFSNRVPRHRQHRELRAGHPERADAGRAAALLPVGGVRRRQQCARRGRLQRRRAARRHVLALLAVRRPRCLRPARAGGSATGCARR